MKYLFGAGAVIAVAVGAFLLFVPGQPDPAPDPVATAPRAAEPVPDPAPASAPASASATSPATTVDSAASVLPEAAPSTPTDDKVLESMAAETRETLPSAVTDTLTMTDALFLPRMRIMEYTYVTTDADARASAAQMRTLIEAGAQRLCQEGREMFGMGVTLRNSFQDRDGTVFQRVYLLPEDCRKFY